MNINENIKIEISDKSNYSDTNLNNIVQTNTSRCMKCKKKIGLVGFKCKCNYFYCGEHRYSENHECTFDYKALGKELLNKNNPTIVPKKLDSI